MFPNPSSASPTPSRLTTARRSSLSLAFLALLATGWLASAACAQAQREEDKAAPPVQEREVITRYEGEIPSAEAPPQRRRVLVDRYHETIFHRGSGTHAAHIWLELMDRDGFEVSYLDVPIDAAKLAEVDLFILAGLSFEAGLMHTAADGEQTLMLRSPLLREEVEALARWVGSGGALMVFASHYPNGGGARPLLEALGVRFRDGFVSHSDHPNPLGGECSWFTMTRGNQLLRQEHPVLAAAAPGLEVESVRWLCGAGLIRMPQDVLLDLPDGTLNISPREGAPPARELGDDYAAALAFDYGAGKVFASGDQGLFRNLLYNSEQGSFHVTITDPEADNDFFLVRLMRWLAAR